MMPNTVDIMFEIIERNLSRLKLLEQLPDVLKEAARKNILEIEQRLENNLETLYLILTTKS